MTVGGDARRLTRMCCFPDYNRSPVAVSRALAAHYCALPSDGTLPELEARLRRKPQHIVLLVFDGMGSRQLEKFLTADSFLPTNTIAQLSSVFPSTTVAAMNSFYSALSPLEHGWLGWSLYFKEAGRAVDIFPRVDSVTGAALPSAFDPWQRLAYDPLVDRIAGSAISPQVTCIAPSGISFPGSRLPVAVAETLEQWFEAVSESVKTTAGVSAPTFTIAYWPDPDSLLHRNGSDAPGVQQCMNQVDELCGQLARSLPQDSLLLISADHGHIDITEYIDIALIPGFMEALVMPPFLEARAAMCYVKHEKRRDFEALFKRYLAQDFRLFSRAEMLTLGLFGLRAVESRAHPLTEDFLADYLIAATGTKALKHYGYQNDHSHDFASHHAGLTADEMRVPLVAFST